MNTVESSIVSIDNDLINIVHITSEDSMDAMFVYAPSDLAFTLNSKVACKSPLKVFI